MWKKEWIVCPLALTAATPVGANTIATAISEDQGTFEEVYEPFLIKEGFIVRTQRGRIATEMAYRHLGMESELEANKTENGTLF